ncbi:bifunctional 3-(3-hydroxy-phenyl)propionate/3-hydroxycinnamic acid hydroxylase MhpA [Enemella evansiae]|nr:bifunctional 3-(3-hydroxy-phenyl)propionate/3-hydroxycinnamic acid hydroxylase [Enemella evansiae]
MTTDYDVIQIGFGPVGHISTALLAQNDHSVGIFERSPEQYPLPRAGHIDHEIMRIFQGVGAAHEFEKFAIPIPDYDMLNKHGQVLIHLDWNAPTPSGWKSDYLIYQPHMEDALCEAMGRIGGYDLHRGWEATAIVQHPDHVEVHVRENRRIDGSWQAAGPERVVTAKYLIGADGAGSFTRRTVGIEMDDLGFEHDWLVTDIRPHDPDVFVDMPQGGAQVCDPARPTSMFRWLGRNHLRWEFKLRDDEKPEEMATEEKVFELLAKWDVGPDRFDIIRRTVYTFRSLLARSFRKDRVLLIGDAAHLMPPFMGQGMCSGIRDATALAWRLDLILRGVASDELLDGYTSERSPHVRKIIDISVELGKVICVTDEQEAEERDRFLLSGEAPPPEPFPWLTDGFLQPDPTTPEVGQLGVQGRIIRDGRTGMADDLIGTGWTLFVRRPELLDELGAASRGVLEDLRAHAFHVTQAQIDSPRTVIDIDATYSQWFARLGATAVLVRPDYYVYGTASTLEELEAMLSGVREQLGVPVSAASAAR